MQRSPRGFRRSHPQMRVALDACLVGPLKPTLFAPEPLKYLPDPFPGWERVPA